MAEVSDDERRLQTLLRRVGVMSAEEKFKLFAAAAIIRKIREIDPWVIEQQASYEQALAVAAPPANGGEPVGTGSLERDEGERRAVVANMLTQVTGDLVMAIALGNILERLPQGEGE